MNPANGPSLRDSLASGHLVDSVATGSLSITLSTDPILQPKLTSWFSCIPFSVWLQGTELIQLQPKLTLRPVGAVFFVL